MEPPCPPPPFPPPPCPPPPFSPPPHPPLPFLPPRLPPPPLPLLPMPPLPLPKKQPGIPTVTNLLPLPPKSHKHSKSPSLPIDQLQDKNATPLVTALQDGGYRIKWTKCTELPFPMSYASVVVDKHESKIYITAGGSPNSSAYNKVFGLDIMTSEWNYLPPSEHRFGILHLISGKLCIIGGSDVTTCKFINKISTYNEENSKWIQFYPNMLSPRFKPGVVTCNDHVVVLGGEKDHKTINDDIEVLDTTRRNLQWERSTFTLPVPMWCISPSIIDKQLYIVGYTQPKGTSNKTYRLSIGLLILLQQQPEHAIHLDKEAIWFELPRAPHYFTALVPELYPPIIMGGGNNKGDSPTADVCLYNISGNGWKRVASLATARLNTTVVTINESTVITFGGYTDGRTPESAIRSCIASVEIGQAVKL